MPKADGSIYIDTKIDDKGLIKGIRDMSSKSIKLANDIKKTESEINNLESAMKKMANTRLNHREVLKLEEQIANAHEELNRMYEDAMKYEKSIQLPGLSEDDMQRVYENDKAWQKMASDIQAAEQELFGYERKLKGLQSDTSTQADTSDFQKKAQKLDYTKAKLEELKKKQDEMPSSSKRIGKAIEKIGDAGKKGFGKCVSVLSKVRKTGVSAFQAITKHSTRGHKSVNKMNGGLFQSLKFMKRMAGTMIFFQAFAKVTDSIGNTISTLVMKDTELAKSLAQVKANMATAFTPIWNAALPYIKELVNWLAVATAKVGGFLSALTGMKATSMAGTVGETADNMEKVSKATKEANHQLNSYDKLNVRSKDKKTDKDEPAGVTANGTTTGNWDSLVNKLKESWKKEDFSWLGKMLAKKINTSMANIPWKSIKKNAKKIAKCIGSFFNGFIGKLNWRLIGKTMAQGLNTAILFLNTLLTTIKWGKLGKGIAQAMNGFLKKTDWTGAGHVIRNCLNAIFKLARTWSNTFDFDLLGTALASAVNGAITGINWKDALKAGTNFGAGIANAANSFIHKTDFMKLGKTVAGFIKVGVNAWYANVTTFNFKQLGTKIGDSINGFFKEMNQVDDKTGLSGWEKLGQSITQSIGGLVDTIIYALDNVNWKEVGTSVGTTLANLDWIGILGKVAKAIWAAIKGALVAWKSWFDAEPVSASIVAAIIAVCTATKFLKIASKIAEVFSGKSFISTAFGGFGKSVGSEMQSSVITGVSGLGKNSKIKRLFSGFGKALGMLMGVQIGLQIAGSISSAVGSLIARNKDGTIDYEKTASGDYTASVKTTVGLATESFGTMMSSLASLDFAGFASEWKRVWSGQAWKDEAKLHNKKETEKKNKKDSKTISAETGIKDEFEQDEYKKETSSFIKKMLGLGKSRQDVSKIVQSEAKEMRTQGKTWDSVKSDYDKYIKKATADKAANTKFDSQGKVFVDGLEKITSSMDKFGVSSKKQSKIRKALQKAVDNHSISEKEYGKIVGKNYKNGTDFNNILEKLKKASEKNAYSSKQLTTESNKLKDSLGKVGFSSEKAKEGSNALKKALDNGKISWTDYKKICDGSYQSTDELYNAIEKVAGKKVTASVKATVEGKKSVDDVVISLGKVKDKSAKVTLTADTAKFDTKVKDSTTGKTVDVSLNVNKETFADKVRNALKGSKFQMSAAQLFPNAKQISEYFKQVTSSKDWKNFLNIKSFAGIGKVKVDSKKKTAQIPKLADMGGFIANMYTSMGYRVSYYAKGGLPKKGELFVANEEGPEMVAKLGNHSAVANRQQIKDEINTGVVSAMKSVLKSASGITIPTANISGDIAALSAMTRQINYYAKNMSTSKKISNIPALATGRVLPPNKEFLAVVGDPKSGTNVETPLSTMVDAMYTALNKVGIGSGQHITINMDGKEVYNVVVKRDKEHFEQYGKSGMAGK